MAQEPRNLTLRRAPTNIWEQPGWTPDTSTWDRERLLVGLWGAGLALYGLRRRGWPGALMAAAGTGVLVRAARGSHDLTRARVWTDRALRARGWRIDDIVEQSSEESFPASDVPSWTPTAGATTKR